MIVKYFSLPWRNSSQWAMASSLLRFRDHTQTHDLRLDSSGHVISPTQRPLPDNIHSGHNRQTSKPPAEFEPTILANEQPQTHTLDCAATGINTKILEVKMAVWSVVTWSDAHRNCVW